MADVISRINVSRATFVGRVYDVSARAPMAAFSVSKAGNEATRRLFQNGEFEFTAAVSAEANRTLAILRIEAPDYTYCERKVEVFVGVMSEN